MACNRMKTMTCMICQSTQYYSCVAHRLAWHLRRKLSTILRRQEYGLKVSISNKIGGLDDSKERTAITVIILNPQTSQESHSPLCKSIISWTGVRGFKYSRHL